MKSLHDRLFEFLYSPADNAHKEYNLLDHFSREELAELLILQYPILPYRFQVFIKEALNNE